jgi:NAD(P)-dependent dehydrogenase (short-subunit alcohol dehydrogenase family)
LEAKGVVQNMPAHQPNLSGQHIFITGAGRGLGKAMAEKLALLGATVAVTDLDLASCEAVAADIRAVGGKAHAYALDVANRDNFMAVAAQFATVAGRIDAVINNAMLLKYEPVENISAETLSRMTAIGINGSVWGTQALLKHYDAARGGNLINLTSPVAEKGFPNTAAYSLVKGALYTLTRVLSAELGPKNIRVNSIAPGSVPTPGAVGLNDKAEYERRSRTIPLRRLGHENDVADACAFLLSDAASFINGENLHVDGGIAAAG